MLQLRRIGHIGLTVRDVDRAANYCRDILGLQPVGKANGAIYLRLDHDHHAVALHAGARPGVHHLGIEVQAAGAAADHLRANGVALVPIDVDEPGQGRAVRCADPDGNVVELYEGMDQIAEPPAAHENRARKFGHITLAVKDLKAAERFYCSLLGFRVSDRMGDKATWARCNPDHHGLALIEAPQAKLHHFALEVFDWATMRQTCDFLLSRGVPILYGPGRHGPGYNLFTYFASADGNMVEYFCDMLQIWHDDKGRPTYEAQVWKPEPRTINQWGMPPPEGFLAGDMETMLKAIGMEGWVG
jgi:catechol 2,3-dioxygenase-like lactoylglutathione lyase family enzyme